ncbi:hypothetical protein [Streptomyces sp. NPDC003090]|uniref:hypothetical protein n=1 Tax=Streptomyces sp. NPDC003090 TaxID=3154274 RepID=UPI003814ACE8
MVGMQVHLFLVDGTPGDLLTGDVSVRRGCRRAWVTEDGVGFGVWKSRSVQ